MNILQLCIRYPPAPGGAETHVRAISEKLIQRGHKVSVFTSDLYSETPFRKLGCAEQEIVNGVKVKRFRGYTIGGEAHYVFLPSMLKHILKERFDIIHTHSYGYFQTNIAAFAKYLTKKPLVFTPHFHPFWSMAGGGKRKLLRAFYDAVFSGFVFNAADIIICHSKHECSLMGLNRSNKIRIIPAGIDFSRFDPIPDGKKFKLNYGIFMSGANEYTGNCLKQFRSIDENTRMVLFSGRLASNKGLHILVDAMPMVL
ncbi:MAG: glycosyltransferase family 4 protein, partial [Candidatus Thermoplasmatota archaeon]|nr:glycosyltransferase family 4 protein [Candidatus Thermoplasmatota archaeon]